MSSERTLAKRIAAAVKGFVGYSYSHHDIGAGLIAVANEAATEITRLTEENGDLLGRFCASIVSANQREHDLTEEVKSLTGAREEAITDVIGLTTVVYELESKLAALTEGAMKRTMEVFDCSGCGVGVSVDEDGCCVTCGADTYTVFATVLISSPPSQTPTEEGS